MQNFEEVERVLRDVVFKPYRVNPKREFFRIEPEQAIAILKLLHPEEATEAVAQQQRTDLDEESINAAKQLRSMSVALDQLAEGVTTSNECRTFGYDIKQPTEVGYVACLVVKPKLRDGKTDASVTLERNLSRGKALETALKLLEKSGVSDDLVKQVKDLVEKEKTPDRDTVLTGHVDSGSGGRCERIPAPEADGMKRF